MFSYLYQKLAVNSFSTWVETKKLLLKTGHWIRFCDDLSHKFIDNEAHIQTNIQEFDEFL